jgi:hypothetical protein
MSAVRWGKKIFQFYLFRSPVSYRGQYLSAAEAGFSDLKDEGPLNLLKKRINTEIILVE